VRFAVKKSAET
jgi:hypothetical protein